MLTGLTWALEGSSWTGLGWTRPATWHAVMPPRFPPLGRNRASVHGTGSGSGSRWTGALGFMDPSWSTVGQAHLLLLSYGAPCARSTCVWSRDFSLPFVSAPWQSDPPVANSPIGLSDRSAATPRCSAAVHQHYGHLRLGCDCSCGLGRAVHDHGSAGLPACGGEMCVTLLGTLHP
jgi:hypothetical protein